MSHERYYPRYEVAKMGVRLGWHIVLMHYPYTDPYKGTVCCSCALKSECAHIGNHPKRFHWLSNPTPGLPLLYQWYGGGGADNIGFAPGLSQKVVIDVDGRNGGFETLILLKDKSFELTETVTVKSGSGEGRHYIYNHPGGYIPTRSNALGSGIDIKADGGCVTLPGSQHKSGREYEWLIHPDDCPFADLPEWVLREVEKIQSRPQYTGTQSNGSVPDGGDRLTPYGKACLNNAWVAIEEAVAGEQEQTLNKTCFGIGKLVGQGKLPADFSLEVLYHVARQIPTFDLHRRWNNHEIEKKVYRSFQQGVGYGKRLLSNPDDGEHYG